MTQSRAATPPIGPRRTLSARLVWLTTLAVLLSEIVVFLPDAAHERHNWLEGRVEDASIATLAAAGSLTGPIDVATRDELLHLSGTEAIRLIRSDGSTLSVGDLQAEPALTIDLRREGLLTGIRRALSAIVLQRDRQLRVLADSPFHPEVQIALDIREGGLSKDLREFAGDFAGLSLVIAGITGGLVYLAVLVLLVRPMRRITGSIAAFRADPERTTPLDPDDVSVLGNDEMSVAGRELAAMQHELRAALWRNARLAALGTMFAKVSHDLRGILTPALLTADRLQLNADPKVQRAGEVLVQAVDRASDLVRRALDYAREGPPPLELAPVELASLANEAAETARPIGGTFRMVNAISPVVHGRADRNQLFRVLVNLLRNAAEAGAGLVRVAAEQNGAQVMIEIADDGPGLPEAARAHLFRPFAGSIRRGGSGLGMAIARDLMVAHGGDIELVETGPGGTTFRLILQAAEPIAASRESQAAEISRAAGLHDARIARTA